jgi:hypothetical protein
MHCDALCFTAWRVFDTSLNIHDGSSFAGCGWRNPETCDEARSMFNVRVYLTNTCLASFDRAVTGACYLAARPDGSGIRLNTRVFQALFSFSGWCSRSISECIGPADWSRRCRLRHPFQSLLLELGSSSGGFHIPSPEWAITYVS